MAFYTNPEKLKAAPKKRTSIGNGLRKRGSFKRKNKKPLRGQGRN